MNLRREFPKKEIFGLVLLIVMLANLFTVPLSSTASKISFYWFLIAIFPIALAFIFYKRFLQFKAQGNGRDWIAFALSFGPLFIWLTTLGIGGYLNEALDKSTPEVRVCKFESGSRCRRFCTGIKVHFDRCPSGAIVGFPLDKIPIGSPLNVHIKKGFFGSDWISQVE